MRKWDPFKDAFILRERLNRLFEQVAPRTGERETGVWVPVVDICETDEAFVVKAELPEVMKEDVAVIVEDNTLTISGERKPRREGRSYYQIERCYGVFSRSFILPAIVEKDGIRVALKDGMLNITLPKRTEPLPGRVEIT